MTYLPNKDFVSSSNSSTTAIDTGSNFTGEWEEVYGFSAVKVAIKTDQDGYYELQWSPDGVNTDSTLTRYYRTSQIEPPHKFENMRRYFRIIFYNNSGTNQTIFRLQTTFTNSGAQLNIPVDGTMSQDYDAISVRPTDFTTEVGLGRRQGSTTWNKFGYNEDVDTTNAEVIAEFGGAFNQQLDNAETLNIVSSSTQDDSTGTGVRTLVIFGVGGTTADAREDITDVVVMDGTTTVTSNLHFWGVNRMTIFQSGTSNSNVGTITATASTSGNTMATMPAEEGTTQQMIIYVPENTQFLATWLYLNAIKSSGGGNPAVTFKGYVYSEVVDSQFEVFRDGVDTSAEQHIDLTPAEPFVVGEKSILWFEAETSSNNTSVRGRFSGKLIKDADV